MSDHSISIVPKVSSYANKDNKAKEILDWLVSLDIVKPTSSDCILGSDPGYAVSDGAKKIVDEPEYLPFQLNINGLEVITERQIFDSVGYEIEALVCPTCNEDIWSGDMDFVDEWSEGKSDELVCPACEGKADINKYSFAPEWGFSNLGFSFWNWPELKESFVKEFEKRLGCEVRVVVSRI